MRHILCDNTDVCMSAEQLRYVTFLQVSNITNHPIILLTIFPSYHKVQIKPQDKMKP